MSIIKRTLVSLGLITVVMILGGCSFNISKMDVTNANMAQMKNGTYYYQSDKSHNHIVDINQQLSKINPKNPYQGVTFKRINDNVVQVMTNGQAVPHLYEVLKLTVYQRSLPATVDKDTFTAQGSNLGDYVANIDPKNYQSAVNYTIANTYNGTKSLSRSAVYQKLIHKGLYRPAFAPEIAKQAVDHVYQKMPNANSN